MPDLQPFDPSDAFDASAEAIRRQVCDIAIDAGKVAIFRDLPADEQMAALMAGLLTGTIGVLFAFIEKEGRDEVMKAIAEYLPKAGANAEAILDGGDNG